MLKQFQFKAIPSSSPKNNLLYHYTNASGLHGIITSGALWATKMQHLNDSKEFRHAVDVAKKELDSRLQASAVTEEEHYLFKMLIERVDSMKGANTFIFSMSEEPDLLSQWRAYGGKGGFSIGFNFNSILTLAHKQGFRLIKCIYDIERQKELINYLIDEVKNIFLEDPAKHRREKGVFSNKFYSPFLLMASTMKHESFQEEREWRLIGGPFSTLSRNCKWRPTISMLLPYYVFDLNNDEKLAIENIIIGPNPEDRQLVIYSTNTFLGSFEKHWTTTYSECPYRVGHNL
jgi:hypothetical protein